MLGYCTNVHQGNTFQDVLHTIQTFCKPICNSTHNTGVGLWFSNQASQEVDTEKLRDTLHKTGVKLFTLNGFPYSDFHEPIVKHNVYMPNWCTEERLEYTLRLAAILAEIVDTKDAGISTVPLGWDSDTFENKDAALQVQRCIEGLQEIEHKTGVCIHLDFEPEPGCRLQRSSDLSTFVNTYFGDNEMARRYLQVCHDTCHAAVMHETAQESIAHYKEAGLKIGKVQLSCAIEVDFTCGTTNQVLEDLKSIAEPRYLHQTTIQDANGVSFYENLTDVSCEDPSGIWRVHFHVPIHARNFGSLGTTQADLQQSIPLLAHAGTTDWEVETYTWSVMPSELRIGDLVDSISKELEWAASQIYT